MSGRKDGRDLRGGGWGSSLRGDKERRGKDSGLVVLDTTEPKVVFVSSPSS